MCKGPPRTLCFLPEEVGLTVERHSRDSAIQDLLWEKASPSFVTEGSGSCFFHDFMYCDKMAELNNHRR